MGTTEYAGDDRRWEAIERRDARAAGAFVYAVRTTGVYCRPACPSRRPSRPNVAFFDAPVDAERAGFRACRRCRPGASADDRAREAVARACSILGSSESSPTLGELASAVGLSPGHFQRTFKARVGVTPKGYAMAIRAKKLRDGLANGDDVAGAIFGAGFGSVARAYEGSAGDLGMTPAEYRGGAEGRPIRYAVADTPLGLALVAATEIGVCSIELGDSAEALEARLRARFPGAELAGDDPAFADRLRRVVALVGEPGRGHDLPLDVRGTAFQRRVWEALREIPAGSTATYADVARSIGRPTSARAVARACGSNGLAVAIPCHRVVRGDGGLGGFRWGLDRKRALLDAEAGTEAGGEPVPPAPGTD